MSPTRLSTPKSVNACAGMGGDAREDVSQPGLRIEPFIFAVYAAQRTMPKGAGDDQLLRRAGTVLHDAGPRSIRHSSGGQSASRKAIRRSLGRKRVRLAPSYLSLNLRCTASRITPR